MQLLLLEKENEDDYLYLIIMLNKPRKPINIMFVSRDNESF